MNIASRKSPEHVSLVEITFGAVFVKDGTYFERVNPGVHVDASYGWGVTVDSGLLTKFDPKAMVKMVEGEFVPK